MWELFPELKGTLVEKELRQVLEDHVQVSYEFYYPKDQHWYETKGYPAPPGAILVFRDITAKKTASSIVLGFISVSQGRHDRLQPCKFWGYSLPPLWGNCVFPFYQGEHIAASFLSLSFTAFFRCNPY